MAATLSAACWGGIGSLRVLHVACRFVVHGRYGPARFGVTSNRSPGAVARERRPSGARATAEPSQRYTRAALKPRPFVPALVSDKGGQHALSASATSCSGGARDV